MMENETKELYGEWVQATGTTLAAIGSTPLKSFTESQLLNFILWGNELQALGNSLIADSEPNFTLDKIGNQIQATGNVTVIAGLILPVDEGTTLKLDIKGNLLQALGGSTSLSVFLDEESSFDKIYILYGILLQVIGNSMQAIGGIIDLGGGEGGKIITIGSWIQAIGSIIQAVGVTNDYVDKYGS